MHYGDLINGILEFMGSLAVFHACRKIYQDKGYAGLSVYNLIFFTSWSVYNLFFYPSVHLRFSFIGSLFLVIANMSYLALLVHYGHARIVSPGEPDYDPY